MTIIFYDIPSTVPGIAWSPNTWKVRYCLNFKGIPYKTEWVEYPDIAAHCKKLGIAPTRTNRDGSPYYSLPAIHDPSTGVYMADSIPIAEYLEKQYPNTPSVFPHNTLGLQMEFENAFDSKMGAMWNFVIPAACSRLNPVSEEFYRRTREKSYGKKIEDIAPKGEDAVTEWAKVEHGLGEIARWYSKNGGNGPFLMGETLSWADFVVGGHMVWFRNILGTDSREWTDIVSWQGGIWKTFCESLAPYEAVD
ncbi:hypothetical protein BDZ97DRAFT_1658354 [Flammula alnicola]|nr:hypothetical protein BDZ97DRAFT_1658354 [Flammula alnicola]